MEVRKLPRGWTILSVSMIILATLTMIMLGCFHRTGKEVPDPPDPTEELLELKVRAHELQEGLDGMTDLNQDLARENRALRAMLSHCMKKRLEDGKELLPER